MLFLFVVFMLRGVFNRYWQLHSHERPHLVMRNDDRRRGSGNKGSLGDVYEKKLENK